MHGLIIFANWLGSTPLTEAVAGHFWVVPALQTVHILSMAAVLIGVALINLRIVGEPTHAIFRYVANTAFHADDRPVSRADAANLLNF